MVKYQCISELLTRAGLSLGQIVKEGVELKTTQQRKAGTTLSTASKGREGRGGGEGRHQDVAEQGQRTCHIALGQMHAHQAEQGVRLREAITQSKTVKH